LLDSARLLLKPSPQASAKSLSRKANHLMKHN
jgi:hypothetical protein